MRSRPRVDSKNFDIARWDNENGARPAATLKRLQPLLYLRPKLSHVRFQIVAEINVRPSFKRHRPRTANDLTQVFNRGELLALVVVPGVEHQSNFASPIPRSPEKIILMSGNRRWQPKPGTKEIDRPSLTIVLAEDGCAPFIFGRQVIIDVPNRRDHFLPAKLIGEKLRQRSGMRCFSAWQLQTNGSHVRNEFGRRQNRHGQRRK